MSEFPASGTFSSVRVTTYQLREAFSLCRTLLDDSEKLLPSAVRCIGFIAEGALTRPCSCDRPVSGEGLSLSSPSQEEMLALLLSTVLRIRADSSSTAEVEERVQSLSPKLAFAVCQAIGFIGKAVSISLDTDTDTDTDVGTESSSRTEKYMALARAQQVLSVMLKLGRPKVQLQACKGLLPLARRSSSSSAAAAAVGASLIPCLDAALIATHSASCLFMQADEKEEEDIGT